MRRGLVLSVAALLLVGLSGCAADAPVETLKPTPWPPQTTAAPISTVPTDAAALEIGIAAMQAYQDGAVIVLDQGHDDTGILTSTSTVAMTESNEELLKLAAEGDWSAHGNIVIDNAVLLTNLTVNSVTTIGIAACTDTANMIATREDGTPSRPDEANTIATMRFEVNNSESTFKVSSMERYEEEDLCS